MKTKIDLVKLAIGAIFFAILMWCALGCNVAEKAVKKYQASSAFPGDCADSFPIRFSPGKIDTIQGPTVDCDSLSAIFDAYWRQKNATGTAPDTVYIQGKAIATPAPPNKKAPCPPSTHRVDTVENTAALQHVRKLLSEAKTMHQNEVKLLNKYLAKSQKKLSTRNKQALAGWGIIALLGIIHFRTQLAGLLTRPWSLFLALFRRKK